MTRTIFPSPIRGEVTILPSKSHLHRLLICAALADRDSVLRCEETDAEDVLATMRCLTALGSVITRVEGNLHVRPLKRDCLPKHCILPCGESGSTLRFLLPVVCALGVQGEFQLEGRLPQRPIAPLDQQLMEHGCRLWREGNTLCCEGQLTPGDFTLPGNVSSQYISGLLFALPLLASPSTLSLEGNLESADYIAMTIDALKAFSLEVSCHNLTYGISGGASFRSPGEVVVEGDWSNAAFWLCAGALPGGAIRCRGLHPKSRQGDKAICEILEAMGAHLVWEDQNLLVFEGTRQAVEIDASPIPDLVPALSCLAAVSEGETFIKNAGRLRLKESDRLFAVTQTLRSLGAQITEETDALRISGIPQLQGGPVDAWGDHRIAMMAAIATAACRHPVTISGAEAVRKSYPAFWTVLSTLGVAQKEEPQ